MSRTLSTNSGSLDSLNVSERRPQGNPKPVPVDDVLAALRVLDHGVGTTTRY